MLSDYFELQLVTQPLLATSFNTTLVVLSVIVAIVSAYTGTILIAQLRRTVTTEYFVSQSNWFWWFAATFILSLGIFTMHFTGMLAFEIGQTVTYDLVVTLISFVVMFVFVGLGVQVFMNKGTLSSLNYLMVAIYFALGLGLLHYIGMEAFNANATLYYDPMTWIESIVIAILGFVASMFVLRSLHNQHPSRQAITLII